MPFRSVLLRGVFAAAFVSLTACSAPEQQTGAGAPVVSPNVAQMAVEERAQQMESEDLARGTDPKTAGTAAAPRKQSIQGSQPPAMAAAVSPLMEPDSGESPAWRDTERYQPIQESAVRLTAEHPVSTFSIDVDTGAYANVRRFLTAGQLPPRDAVRIEEMLNYFTYDNAPPAPGGPPFAVYTEIAPSPWNIHTHLLRISLKGRDVAASAMPPANLVFLIDVSGSMSDANKLPLLKTAFKALTRQLRRQDRISLVVYAGASGVVLEPTPGDQQDRILNALERLSAGGSTHGAAGIELAYEVARRAFISGGINRVLLATDGDFNVGVTQFERLKDMIEEKRRSGVSLSTLGFGTGNFNEHMMEQLADAGNGNYSYIDTLNEGRKVLVDELTSTLTIIAKDVKIQIEFNPAAVAEYRLIGYENRVLRREDFKNDKIDAGEIGAGHSVTALYEIRLAGKPGSLVDPLRYQSPRTVASDPSELARLRLRYKGTDSDTSELMQWPLTAGQIKASLDQASVDFRFAASVAGFGQLLRGGHYLEGVPSSAAIPAAGTPAETPAKTACREQGADTASGKCGNVAYDFDAVIHLARSAQGTDRFGYRAEFLELVAAARRISSSPSAAQITGDVEERAQFLRATR